MIEKMRRQWNYWKHLWKTDGEFGFKMDVKLTFYFILLFVLVIVIEILKTKHC